MAGKKSHRLRARMDQAGGAQVKMLLQHPMETGNRKDPVTGQKIPRYFIRELHCEHNDTEVLTAHWSWGISPNPYLSFRIKRAKRGDRIRVRWLDNRDGSHRIETEIL